MQAKTFMRDIAHPLDESEVTERNDKAQRLELQADELARQLKEDTKDRKAAIEKLRSDARRFRHTAFERKELRKVQCYEELRGSQVYVIRMDTGETVDQRALEAGEQVDAFPGLDKPEDDLPLEPDYTPSNDDSLKVPSERKPKKVARKKR